MRRLALAVMLMALVACGDPVSIASISLSEPPRAELPTSSAVDPISAPSFASERESFGGLSTDTIPHERTLVAMAIADTNVFEQPGASEPLLILPHTTILGTVSVLEVVEGPVDEWLRVRLPIRPNGSEGWVAADDVMMYTVDTRLVVDLSERVLSYYEDGDLILTTPVAVGSDRNPTPVGDFYVTDNVTLADPGSPWGPHAFGISARSDTITEYNGGDGIIGIHGTNRPKSIGNAASLGCVRVPNDVITRLHQLVPIGTPVEINA